MIRPNSTWNKDGAPGSSAWNVVGSSKTCTVQLITRLHDIAILMDYPERTILLDLHPEEERLLRQSSSISTRVCSML